MLLHALQTASYELLVRRMMLRAPGAAFLSVAAFNFLTTSVPRQAMNPEDPGYPGEMVTLPNSYYGSGACSVRLKMHVTWRQPGYGTTARTWPCSKAMVCMPACANYC